MELHESPAKSEPIVPKHVLHVTWRDLHPKGLVCVICVITLYYTKTRSSNVILFVYKITLTTTSN